MSMNLTEEEVQAWWNEVDKLIKEMVKPCVPMPKPEPIIIAEIVEPKWVTGNQFFTLKDDRQFAVESMNTNAIGWSYE